MGRCERLSSVSARDLTEMGHKNKCEKSKKTGEDKINRIYNENSLYYSQLENLKSETEEKLAKYEAEIEALVKQSREKDDYITRLRRKTTDIEDEVFDSERSFNITINDQRNAIDKLTRENPELSRINSTLTSKLESGEKDLIALKNKISECEKTKKQMLRNGNDNKNPVNKKCQSESDNCYKNIYNSLYEQLKKDVTDLFSNFEDKIRKQIAVSIIMPGESSPSPALATNYRSQQPSITTSSVNGVHSTMTVNKHRIQVDEKAPNRDDNLPQNEDGQWKTVHRVRSHKGVRQKSVGQSEPSGNFRGVAPKLYVYLHKVSLDSKDEDLLSYVKNKSGKSDEELIVKKVLSNDKNFNSFLLVADFKFKDMFYNPAFWPVGIRYKRFDFKLYYERYGIKNVIKGEHNNVDVSPIITPSNNTMQQQSNSFLEKPVPRITRSLSQQH
nr:unnamed protein product [Callosobruchus chinensis]